MKKKVLVVLFCLCALIPAVLFASGKSEATTAQTPAQDSVIEQPVDKNVSMKLTFLTHKQGMEEDFAKYQVEFNKIYPNVQVIYEPIGDYKKNIEIRWTSNNWGDMCMIPHMFISETQLPELFAPLGKVEEFEKKYEFASAFSIEGDVYGISSTGTAYGVLYNKKVLQQAGVTEIPKSPEAFFDALRKVKANTAAIPLYCNYGAGSRLADWEWNARGSLTADGNYKNKLVYMENPFSPGKPYYTVMKMLYDVVAQDLVEDDPATSNWDTCKNLLAQGKVAATVIGSWATVDTQKAAEDSSDIVFAAFPWNNNGKQYATIAADYAYAINKNISADRYQVARDYILFLTEKSGYSFTYGGIPIMKGEAYPQTLKALQDAGVTLVLDNPPHPQDIGLFDELNAESELYLGKYPQKARIVEAAMGQTKESFDSIMEDWNKRWTAAQISIIGKDYATKNRY